MNYPNTSILIGIRWQTPNKTTKQDFNLNLRIMPLGGLAFSYSHGVLSPSSTHGPTPANWSIPNHTHIDITWDQTLTKNEEKELIYKAYDKMKKCIKNLIIIEIELKLIVNTSTSTFWKCTFSYHFFHSFWHCLHIFGFFFIDKPL